MANYVNVFQLPTYSTNEIAGPFTITIEELTTSSGNTIVSAKRFDTSNPSDTGTSIAANVSILDTNRTKITDIWAGAESRLAGDYRIQVVAQDSTGTAQKQEYNGLITIV